MVLHSFDYEIFQWVNSFVYKYPLLDKMMIFFAEYAQYILIVLLFILWITNKENRVTVFQALFACSIAFTMNRVSELFFYRDRPFVSHHIKQLVDHAANSSFPSDHATAALVITVTIWLCNRGKTFMWIIFGMCIAFSRIWVGVHYPFDVLTGIILGGCTALLVHYRIMKMNFLNKITNYPLFHK
ncbi:undecaprenyl-diphosphatase [Bacillus sp. BP-3]|uniref:undecaprenyl-diphosphatase n=1 Tax=Bacillus sp. BP-3 TaxID=3022773 RepID=UPI00232F6E1F|nr:undecaprenyl-diphosphatase [Bacillus sp. BP-3]MDC2864460.1 undecaprenyl-diphosphatase [Bacillus sp. BP-3]